MTLEEISDLSLPGQRASAGCSRLGRGPQRPIAVSLLLTTSMRDFAIAAGLATAAFGSAAAAPISLYAMLVLTWAPPLRVLSRCRSWTLRGMTPLNGRRRTQFSVKYRTNRRSQTRTT